MFLFRRRPKLVIQAKSFPVYLNGLKVLLLARTVPKASGTEIIRQIGGDAA